MNTNYFIPTVVVDDFFDNPDDVRNWALSLDYPNSEPNYPGVRTDALHSVDKVFFDSVVNRFLSLFYDMSVPGVTWEAHAYFQKVGKENKDGWIHRDLEEKVTGIVYLNKDVNINSGTSICISKTIDTSGIALIKGDDETKLRNNSRFEESINLKNRYNRCIGFDSNRYHCANDFDTNLDEDRLTLIFFIRELTAKDYPIYRMKRSGD